MTEITFKHAVEVIEDSGLYPDELLQRRVMAFLHHKYKYAEDYNATDIFIENFFRGGRFSNQYCAIYNQKKDIDDAGIIYTLIMTEDEAHEMMRELAIDEAHEIKVGIFSNLDDHQYRKYFNEDDLVIDLIKRTPSPKEWISSFDEEMHSFGYFLYETY